MLLLSTTNFDVHVFQYSLNYLVIVRSKNVQIEIIYSNISSLVNIPIISNILNLNVTVIISAAANIIITFRKI